MKRDRLATVLHLRELVERQRLAERAAAARTQALAEQALETAIELRADAALPAGTDLRAADLSAHRVQGIALDDLVATVDEKVRDSAEQSDRATQRMIAAAVERRSVERLRERRDAVAAKVEQRRDARRLDEVAIQVWRRSS